jgi:hypothetical protein
VVTTTGARFSVNMISAVTAKGALRFSILTGTLTAATFIDFCKRLLHDTPGPVFLTWTGTRCIGPRPSGSSPPPPTGGCGYSPIRRTPPSSIPTSGSGRTSSTTASPAAGITGPDQFKALAVKALRRLQRLPHVVRGFFADPNLAYITNLA